MAQRAHGNSGPSTRRIYGAEFPVFTARPRSLPKARVYTNIRHPQNHLYPFQQTFLDPQSFLLYGFFWKPNVYTYFQ